MERKWGNNMNYEYTSDQLLDRWEALREIKNLMGRLSADYCIIEMRSMYDKYWSKREDICLGVNEGWYEGASAVKAYYQSIDKRVSYNTKKIRELFPDSFKDKSEEESYGCGMLDYKPVDTPVVEIAADMETAKGIWCIRGSHVEFTKSGPVAVWEWGWFAVDFVKEEDEWKIWHMQYLDEISRTESSKWYGEETSYPEREEFSWAEDVKILPPNKPCRLRELYSIDRPFTPIPDVPVPYRTFSETFSYGIEGGICS
jgi:hypothetical protein